MIMKLRFPLPKIDLNQRKIVSEIFIDIGKLFFAGGVVGFLIPSVANKIKPATFVISLLLSLFCFYLGVMLIKKQNYYEC